MTTAMPAKGLLGPEDPAPVGLVNPDGGSPFLLVCDHAGNAIPRKLGDLGLPAAERERHIAIDAGALQVALSLARRLDAPLVYQRYSRLVIDSNRQPTAADAMAEVADGTPVPGNRDLGRNDRALRVQAIHQPYHRQIAGLLDVRTRLRRRTVFVSVHSFTPRLRARAADRPWEVGICAGDDDAFCRAAYEALGREPELVVGWNEPYNVDMTNDYSIPVHAEGRGLPYVEFEMRQDLLQGQDAAERWAARLERCLRTALAEYGPR